MSFKSHIKKKYIFLLGTWSIYTNGFKYHIKKILCYFFKLKYLNQTLKKHNFFLGNMSVYTNGFQISHLKKKKNTRSRSGHGLTGFGQVVTPAGLLTNPDRSSPRVDPLSRSMFNNFAYKLSTWQWLIIISVFAAAIHCYWRCLSGVYVIF